ncbi:MAG: dihydroorotate dehydrogenase [Candidatus Omnitrophica bacterium]|nr:dihydroorotate dehydrogenase [Candidatus Omnitrophota bacterium]
MLRVKISNHNFSSPLVLAAGTAGFGQELRGLVDFRKVGALTTKTITLKPRSGNPPPRIFEVDCGIINSIGLENKGLAWLVKKFSSLKKISTQIIVSFSSEDEAGFSIIASGLDKIEDLKFLEVNLSCPNVRKKALFAQSPRQTYRIIKDIRRKTDKFIIAKLSPEVTDIVAVARKALAAGADALSLVNTFFALRVDINTRRPFLGRNASGGLSGPAIKPLALYRTWQIYKSLRAPLIAGGGISNWQDALEFIICGATLVSIGTANFLNPQAGENIYEGLKNFCRRNKIDNIRELRGSLKV